MTAVSAGGIQIANERPVTLFGGLNVLEAENPELALKTAEHFAEVCLRLGMPWVFKASFDKANRTARDSYRGPGLEQGLQMLAKVHERFDVPVMTDIHEPGQAATVAEVAEVLQIPAFLCRQTDLLTAAARTGAILNIKKAQFLAPEDMRHVLAKCEAAGNRRLLLCERGTCFGYHNLVVDMLGFDILKDTGYPVLFDVTHALQQPGAHGDRAGGRRAQVMSLTRAALSQGLAGLFLETHPDPDRARCDGPSALPLAQLQPFLEQVQALDERVKSLPPFVLEEGNRE